MAGLARNAARCLRCGDEIESSDTLDYVSCSCGNLSIKGGLSFIRIAGRALDDASYEPLHVYQDGQTVPGRQFASFLDGVVWWGAGDGWAFHRLLAAMVTGTIPFALSTAGKRRLGYLAEIALTMSPERECEKKLLELVEELRERLKLEPIDAEARRQQWLPARLMGPDEKAAEWGLGSGLSEEFRQGLRTRVE